MQLPPQPPLRSLQFSLRTLFLVVTLAGCFCALANLVSPPALAGVALMILALAAHVVGNKLGTILRDHGDQQRRQQLTKSQEPVRPKTTDFAPTTQLGERKSLGLFSLAMALAGVLVGGALSVVAALWLYAHPTRADLIVVGIAGSVLGGIWIFAVTSFLQVGAGAVRQATSHDRDTLRQKEDPRS